MNHGGVVEPPVSETRAVLQQFENESDLDWITRQWKSSFRTGLVRQFSELHDDESGRCIYQFPRVPLNWKQPSPFNMNHDYLDDSSSHASRRIIRELGGPSIGRVGWFS